MATRRPKRVRSKKLQFKARQQKKSPRKFPRPMADHDEATHLGKTHRLLASALRYWEVERDLIEERLAAIASVIVPL
jgi:hypothetical protein